VSHYHIWSNAHVSFFTPTKSSCICIYLLLLHLFSFVTLECSPSLTFEPSHNISLHLNRKSWTLTNQNIMLSSLFSASCCYNAFIQTSLVYNKFQYKEVHKNMNLPEPYFRMFIIIQSTQFWYKHTMHLHILHVLAILRYKELLQSPFLLPAVPPCTGQCFHIGSASYGYVVYLIPLCYEIYYILSRFMCDYIWGLDQWLHLLTTYTHNSKLLAITAPPLISTNHSTYQTFLQPGVFSSAIPWQWLKTGEILQLHALKFYLHSLPCRTQLSTDNSQAGGHFIPTS
jgi:hypothetical protein